MSTLLTGANVVLFLKIGVYISLCMPARFKKCIGYGWRLYLGVSGGDVDNCIPNICPLFVTYFKKLLHT